MSRRLPVSRQATAAATRRPATAGRSTAIRLVGWDDPAGLPTAAEETTPTLLLAPQNMRVAQYDDPFEDDRFDAGPTLDEQMETLPIDPLEVVADDAPEAQDIQQELPDEEPSATHDPFEEELHGTTADAVVQATPEAEPRDRAPAPSGGSPLEEAEAAIDKELQRRELEEGLEDELPLENPFRDGPRDDPAEESEEERSALDELLEQLERVLPGEDSEGLQAPESAADAAERRRRFDARRQELLDKQRVESLENCEEEFRKLRADSIDKVDLSIRVEGVPGADYPFECTLGGASFRPRQWSETVYLWKASGLCHKPLYFEQVQLERYGHSWGPCLQPLVSGAHFFMTLPVLPYKMGIRTPTECVYTLGYYRPGSCAPYMIDPVPFTWRAAFFEAGAWTAGALIIP